ncbi:hypothetical protein BFG04_03595 [Campylobacter pinnipediorum subsp. pinnipediorum]|uniref:Periplasmic protein n=1 Tax=Campylobacter pinnipediorum subsp. pinnipediorum TaxID=1660067 RepID=A0AAX0LAV8_9BACT|nr:hypothetical protein [Campylobacter pinnipediorum]OPA78012.1 hypothetical protein BFG04_03595 [Campylobacter pinnipediorum subsp. pinnipediorum]
MKILAYVVGVLLLLFLGVYTIAFTGFGNGIVSNYLEKVIKEKSGFEVKFAKFSLDMSSLDIKANVNDEINFNAHGSLSIFSQKFDIDYAILASNLKSANINLQKPISLKGKAKGAVKDFDVNGAGDLLGSNLSFLTNIKDLKPFTAKVDARKLNIAEALVLAKQPEYAKGYVDLIADIKDENGNRDGDAKIEIYDGIVNNGAVLKDFNITLPKNFYFKGAFNAEIKNDDVNLKSIFITPVATADTKNTHYNLKNLKLSSDFGFKVDDLVNLEPIIKQKLNGSLSADGNLILDNDKLETLNTKINGFGGNIIANLKDNKVKATINQIKLNELLKLASQPAFASATINGNAIINNINDVKNISGNLTLNTKDGKLHPVELKQMSDFDIKNGVDFSLESKADIKDSIVNFDVNLFSDLLSLKNVKGVFAIDKGNMDSIFNLEVSDLAKFEKIVGTKLSGNVNLNGNVKLKNMALSELNVNGKAIGGDINAGLKDGKVDAKLTKLALRDLFSFAGMKPLADATLNLEAKLDSIDVKNLNGSVIFTAENGSFMQKNMSEFLEKKFPANAKFSAKANVDISKSIAKFNANVLSDFVNAKEINGNFDINNNTLDSNLKINIADLRNLKFLTEKELFGAVDVLVNAKMKNNQMDITATSDIFDGKLDAKFKDNLLNATLNKFAFKGLTDMLGMDNFYNGVGDAKFDYNVLSQKGNFNLNINEGRLVANNFTNTLKTFTARDITTEVYKDGYVKGTINKGLVNFDMDLEAQRSSIKSKDAKLNTLTDAIDIPVEFRYEKTDAKIDIKGTSKQPKYSISSDYLKEKALKGLDKLIDKNLGNDGKDGGTKDVVKGLLKGLF